MIEVETVDDAVIKLLTEGVVYPSEYAQIIIDIVFDHAIRFTDSVSAYLKFLKQIMDRKVRISISKNCWIQNVQD